MDNLLSDIRYAMRNLIKRPGFTAIAVLTLALGIGANSSIFSAIYALLLNPLPIPDQDRVMAIWDKNPMHGLDHNEVTVANYFDWLAQNQSFEKLALYRWWSVNVTGQDTRERSLGFVITSNFLSNLGVKYMLSSIFVGVLK